MSLKIRRSSKRGSERFSLNNLSRSDLVFIAHALEMYLNYGDWGKLRLKDSMLLTSLATIEMEGVRTLDDTIREYLASL